MYIVACHQSPHALLVVHYLPFFFYAELCSIASIMRVIILYKVVMKRLVNNRLAV